MTVTSTSAELLSSNTSTSKPFEIVHKRGYLWAAWNAGNMGKDLICGNNPLSVFEQILSKGDGSYYPAAVVDVLARDGFFVKKKTYVVITDPGLGKKMLMEPNNKEDGLYNGGEIFEKTKAIAGKANIITLPFARHKKLVNFAGPFFVTKEVNKHKEAYQTIAAKMITNWAKHSEENVSEGGVNASKGLHVYTSQSIAKALLNFDSNEELPNLIVQMTEKIFKEMHGIPENPFSNQQRTFTMGQAALNEIVDAVYKAANSEPTDSFISAMCHKKENNVAVFSEEEVKDMIKVVFIGGQETTATLLTRSLYYLCKYPEWQQLLVEEALQDKDTLLQAFFAETLRLHPPAYGQARELTQNSDFLETGEELSAGTTLLFLHIFSQKDASRWPDPLSFNPYRFQGLASPFDDRTKLFPFGMGPNICLGKRYAQSIAKEFIQTLVKGHEIKFARTHNGDETMGFMLHLKEDLYITVSQRN